MDSSEELVACLLEELLDQVMMMETESGLSSLSSLGSLTSIPSQQDLPCSQDFQFFFNIAASCPAHSPGEESCPDSPTEELSLPSSLFYPLPSPASQADTRSPPSPTVVSMSSPLRSPLSPTLPPPSPGVCLMPLTQAATQPVHYHTQMGYSDSDSEEESGFEPPAKKIKHKEMRDLTPMPLVEVEEEDGSINEEEDTALPLTFNDSRDLHWKLVKADILRSERALPSQRPASVTNVPDNISSGRKVKIEKKDEDSLGSMAVQEATAQSPGEDTELPESRSRSDRVELGGGIPLQSTNTDRAFSRPLSNVKLLNRPPRIGLSKLNRKLSSLHDVSIIQQEE